MSNKLSDWLQRFTVPEKAHASIPSPIQPTTPSVPLEPRTAKPVVSMEEITEGNKAIRAALEESGYAGWVTAEQSTALATAVLVAAQKVRV